MTFILWYILCSGRIGYCWRNVIIQRCGWIRHNIFSRFIKWFLTAPKKASIKTSGGRRAFPPERISEQSGSLSSEKEAVGLWHWRHTEMMGVLPGEHPVKIQGLSHFFFFAPSNAHLAPSLPLSEVTAEKFQWCPRRPRIIIQVCVCIYVSASERMIDLMCAHSLCVCVFLFMWRSCMDV